MRPRAAETIHHLFLLNLCLQVFDGLATYQVISTPAGEGNPLVAVAMAHLGIGSALLLFKAKACGCLLVLRRLAGPGVAKAALASLAAAYGAFSFFPWMLELARLS